MKETQVDEWLLYRTALRCMQVFRRMLAVSYSSGYNKKPGDRRVFCAVNDYER